MKAWNALFLIAAVLGFSCVQAAPIIQATLQLGKNVQGIAIDPALAKAYVTNFDSGTVSVVDINTLAVVATVPVGTNPQRIIVDAATHRVYLTNFLAPGFVTVLDGTTNAIVATIAVGNSPRELGSNFLIGEVYVSNFGSNSVSVISTATNSVVATVTVGRSPGKPNSNDTLKKLYVTSFSDNTVSVIDEQTRTMLRAISVEKGPINATIDEQHGKVYVNNAIDKTVSIIDSTTDAVVASVQSGAGGSGPTASSITVSPVYHRAYLPNAVDGTLTIIETDDDVVTNTLMLEITPVDAVVDANGGNVYVANQGDNAVSILDAGSETAFDRLAVGPGPWRVADELEHLFVLNSNALGIGSLTIAAESDTIFNTAIATEFYEANFNHYFHTDDLVETRLLVDGVFGDAWHRTFKFWRVWTRPGSGRAPVCRFFSTAFGAKSSHFYTPYAAECLALQTNPALSSVWQLESAAVFYLALTDASGSCPAGTSPLYRVYNNGMGGAPNHRYTADVAVRAFMITQGWVAEGNGPNLIFACTPTLLAG